MLCISGSPRNGATEQILTQISTRFDAALIKLRKCKIKPCKGCLKCVTAPECQINDGMAEIVQKMHESNFIVFGVPNYFDNVSGIFKIFMDRFCPFCKLQLNGNQKFRGKHTIFVYVGAGGLHADAQNVLKNLHTATNGFVNYLGLNVVGEFAFVNSKTKNIVPSQKEIDNMIVNMTRLI